MDHRASAEHLIDRIWRQRDAGRLRDTGYQRDARRLRDTGYRRDAGRLRDTGYQSVAGSRQHTGQRNYLFSRSFRLPHAGCVPSSPMRLKLLEWWRFWSWLEARRGKVHRERTLGPGLPLPCVASSEQRAQGSADHRLWRNSNSGSLARTPSARPELGARGQP